MRLTEKQLQEIAEWSRTVSRKCDECGKVEHNLFRKDERMVCNVCKYGVDSGEGRLISICSSREQPATLDFYDRRK